MSDRYDELEMAALLDAISRASEAAVVGPREVADVFREMSHFLRLMLEDSAATECERITESQIDLPSLKGFEDIEEAFLALEALMEEDMTPQDCIDWAGTRNGWLVYVPECLDIERVRKYLKRAEMQAEGQT